MNGPRDMLISVVVSTYNRPDALERVLSACAAQTDTNYEIIVADDGSTGSTRETVGRCAQASTVRIDHVWQEDDGFRAAEIRNKGIAKSRGDYVIFLDGDCVPQHDFVQRHRQLATEHVVVTGSRILLDETLTQQVIDRKLSLPDEGPGFWARQRMGGHVNKIAPLFIKLPDHKWRDIDHFKWRGIKSCNMSAWRCDLERVNGFDASFVGWGHEDADLVIRLANCNVHRKLGAYATEIFHLWHREQPRTQENSNYERVKARIADGTVRAARGLAELPL
ncbi:glycosyltransferase family 2 protein [Paraburkholderia denitrificans]|uniref:Glycosyltransferase family 2 protein n=1 Tax=Paraburkholderia denitrificans TaxID=694025 RepID=A0ABW0JBG0_9BURK